MDREVGMTGFDSPGMRAVRRMAACSRAARASVKGIFSAFMLVGGWMHPGTTAMASTDVQFAGYAVTGDAGGANASVTVLWPLIQGDAAVAGNQHLYQSIIRQQPTAISLKADGLAALDGSTSTVVVAAAIDRESVLVEQVAADFKLVAEIAGQALFFDFREKQVIASVPVTVQHIDVLPHEPTTEDRADALRRLFKDVGENGFSAAMARAIASARLPGPAARRLQLADVSVVEGALAAWPLLEDRVNSGVVGHEFSKHFAAGTGLALLPFRSGQAIGGAMAARFADGRVYMLEIPEADYVIRLRIERVAHRAVERSAALERRLYGVFFHAVVEEPLSGRRYFEQSLRQGTTKLIPASQSLVDDAAAYYDTLMEAFANFAAASQGHADQWVAEQPGGRDARHQWDEFKELIEKCR
jgi:hypothetical protein